MKIAVLLLTVTLAFSPTSHSVTASLCTPEPSGKGIQGPPPIINKVFTTPIPIRDLWVTLPNRPGVLTIHVDAVHASKVTFWLYPTGTAPKECEYLGEDNDPSDGWSYQFKYGDEPLHTHFVVEAIGSGGSTFNLFHITTE